MPRFAVAFSLSSAGQYLVFDSSDLSNERNELFRIYCLQHFHTDVVVQIYPNGKSIVFGLTLLLADGVVW